MARNASSFITLLRQNSARVRHNPNTHIRNLTGEIKEGDFGWKKSHINLNEPLPNEDQNFTEIAKEICKITRTRPRWEQTLLSEYPSFNFSDPQFFLTFLKQQNNVLLSLRFFNWLCSSCRFSPVQSICNELFDALVDAKACKVAKSFLDCKDFNPEPASLESYCRCLCEVGLVEEALDVFNKLKLVGFCPSIKTWNAALVGCVKIRRTDLVWIFYGEMIESGVVANVDAETVGHLIKAFCDDNKVLKGYELLQQILEAGLPPEKESFNRLITGFCKERQYARVSELLHMMIAKNQWPDIFTYQEVISGLMKKRKTLESFRIFNDLKNRGYFPDRVMYTTMIHGLCKMRWLGGARKLWFEMIQKGILPNEYTYNSLIYGYCKIGSFDEARKLYKDMRDRGYRESTISYNTMISGLCLHGRTDEALNLLEEMSQKGAIRDVITYNSLIRGLCKEGKLVESRNLLNGLLAQGLQPSNPSFTPIIVKLFEVGDIQEAKKLWNDMRDRGLEPLDRTRDHIIVALCEQGYVVEGMEWLTEMLKNKLKPQKQTFEKLIQCLTQIDRLDDSLLVIDSMFSIGYALKESICYSLVHELCKESFHFVEACLGELLERN